MRRFSVVALLLLFSCGKPKGHVAATVMIRELGIILPAPAGWERDESVELDGVRRHLLKELDRGGVIFRMVRHSAIAGSPRIDVVLESRRSKPTDLEEFLRRNLEDMSALERTGSIRIGSVSERAVTVGPRRAYRVRHEYTMPGQAAITQVSTLLVLDGRGVAITAAGRAELFEPLADDVEKIMRGITTKAPEVPGDDTVTEATRPLDLDKRPTR